MNKSFAVTVMTLFPEMFPGPLGHSLAGKALQNGLWTLDALNIRDFATDKHHTVDDTPYGGGSGMVMRPDILDLAAKEAKKRNPGASMLYFTPRGQPFNQKMAHDLIQMNLILVCGRFEGVDERFLEEHKPLEVSIGDYVLSGGEIAAFALLDACIRLLPGVMGDEGSLEEESFALHGDFSGLIEYPHYTKPPVWNGREVPEVLLSGNHAKIHKWRLTKAENLTKALRPDLWARRQKE
jgi:tRNA (guanine37-N1)-methyltransferase